MRRTFLAAAGSALIALALPASAGAVSYLFTIGAPGHALGQFSSPWSMAVSAPPDNRLFVLDEGNHRIERFKLDGTQPFVFPSTTAPGQGDGQLYYPQGITVANNLVYVADTANSRVQVFTLDGAFVRKWGNGEGVGNDQLNHPAGIAVDPQPGGLVYVTDSRNARVQVFTPEGHFVRTIGVPGDADGHLTVPSGIAVSEGHVYVADEQLTKLQRFSLAGAFETKDQVPKFVDQLYIDQSDHVLYAALPAFPGRILGWDITGGKLDPRNGFYDFDSASTQSPSFNGHGVATDAEHNVYVGDNEGGRVLVFGECGPDRRLTRARAQAAAINELRVVAVQPDVRVHREGSADGDWCKVEKDTVLKQGDEISCDPDGSVTLAFADNSTVVVRNTTQLKIASFFTEGGVVRTEILLKMGEVAAKVNKSEATKSDFRIKSPTATASVRGTAFSVFYDPGSKSTTESTFEGTVKVDPAKPGLKTANVKAGKEIEVTAKSESRLAKIGKAGARGGISRMVARDRVNALVARGNGPCGSTTSFATNLYSTKPARRGWTVTVKLVGLHTGTAKWQVTKSSVAPKNALARQLTAGCA